MQTDYLKNKERNPHILRTFMLTVLFLHITVVQGLTADSSSTVYLGKVRYNGVESISCPDAPIPVKLDSLLWKELLSCPVEKLAEEGYPFVNTVVESINTVADTLELTITIDKGERVIVNGIKSRDTNPEMLERLSGLKFPVLYSDKKLKRVRERIAKKPYITTGGTPQLIKDCLLYTSPSPRDLSTSRMPSSA